jgi:hypothetical protein
VSLTVEEWLPAVMRLEVTVSGYGGRSAQSTVAVTDGGAITWPASVSVDVSALPTGTAMLEAVARDGARAVVARGTASVVLPRTGVVTVELRCESLICNRTQQPDGAAMGSDAGGPSDGGAPAGDASDGDAGNMEKTCGNGRLDRGETCDIARTADLTGACPKDCDDGVACTRDVLEGSACTAVCRHIEITTNAPGDGCCPAHADRGTDPDCPSGCGNQRVDPGETCDIAVSAGPGACPTASSCDDADPCTMDLLVSSGTCSARCTHTVIAGDKPGDGCCPAESDATDDADCRPVCGNGVVETGESCDTGITRGEVGACPLTAADCTDDGVACSEEVVTGFGCRTRCENRPVLALISGDGCCPAAGLARSVDSDCASMCGNGILEKGETCDEGIVSGVGVCSPSCPPAPAACLSYTMTPTLDVARCQGVCLLREVACSELADGCCAPGCAARSDPDCAQQTCGNGVVDAGETCDTAIASGAGACPQACADAVPCTTDLLVSAGTCLARCAFVPTILYQSGDGCCPPGAHAGIDSDCSATCGNGVVEPPWETCDTATTPSSCPAACPPPSDCTRYDRTVGNGCNVSCTPVAITACTGGDGCCPTGCDAIKDADCAPRCGNGVIEAGETCDRGISAGMSGACPASCADADACTQDVVRGSVLGCTRACGHLPVTACAGGDRCCPAGCGPDTDADCGGSCGDGKVQANETCDPPSACPTVCADDGDPCTVEQLTGEASRCDVRCVHTPVTTCQTTVRDGCCPSACGLMTDMDC